MSKEIEEFYKQYSARISEIDDTPLFATGKFGEFRMLTIEEYEKLVRENKILAKALELAVETMRYELGREAIKNLYKDAIKNLKDNLNMKFDTEMCEWFIEQAKEMLENE